MCDQQRLRPACAYARSDQSLCKSLEYSMSVKLLTEHHLGFLSLKGGCTGSSELTLGKYHIVGNHMPRLIWSWMFFSTDPTLIETSWASWRTVTRRSSKWRHQLGWWHYQWQTVGAQKFGPFPLMHTRPVFDNVM